MSFTVIKLGEEPILLLRLGLETFAQETLAQGLRRQILGYIQPDNLPLYVIWDMLGKEVAAGDVQLMIFDAQERREGSVADSRLCTLIVSDHPMISMLQRKVQEQFGVDVWQFYSVDDALDWVRANDASGE